MSSFKFLVKNSICEDFYAKFEIEVSNGEVSFTLKNHIIIHVDSERLSRCYFRNDGWNDAAQFVDKFNLGLLQQISDTSYLGENEIISGKLCDIKFTVSNTQIIFGGVKLPENEETRDSLVKLLQHFNARLNELDNQCVLSMFDDYIEKTYKQGNKYKSSYSGTYFKNFFKSKVADDKYKKKYIEALLEHGTI